MKTTAILLRLSTLSRRRLNKAVKRLSKPGYRVTVSDVIREATARFADDILSNNQRGKNL